MYILTAISVAYLAYNIVEILANYIYRGHIIYKNRIDTIKKQSLFSYSSQKAEKKERQKLSIEVPEKLKKYLVMSGVHLRPEEFLIIWLAIIVLPALIAIVLNKNIIIVFGLIGVGVISPPIFLMKMKKKKIQKFNIQLGDSLMIISNSLRGGFTFEQTLASISKDLPDPIGTEFQKIVREVELGEKLEKTMEDVAKKMESDDMELMNTAVAIQRQVGGNLADVLDNIGDTIRERIILKKNIKTLTSQGEISGKIIAALPIVLIVMISLVNREYMMPLFTTPLGYVLLGVSVFLEIVGYVMIKKLINIEM